MGRAAACCAVLFLVASLTWTTPSASAASQVAIAGLGIGAGPEVSGERVVWGVSREGGLQLRSLDADGQVSVIGRPSGVGAWDVSLDEDRLVYSRMMSRCSDAACSNLFLESAEIAHGPVGGPYAPVDLCAGSEIWCRGSSYCQVYLPVELADGVLTHQAVCTLGAAVSRELATGSTRTYQSASTGFFLWSAYGRYVAFQNDPVDSESSTEIVVSDAVTGAELYRIGHPSPTFAVGDGGLLAVVNRATGELSWATPEEPFLHPLGMVPPSSAYVMVRRGAIAVGTSFRRRMEFRLFDLGGQTGLQSAPLIHPDYANWDFDGRRLAWAEAPCDIAIIVAWDVRDEFPTTSASRCPAARVVRARKRLSTAGRVVLRLACPAEPQLGCSGAVRLETRAPRGRSVMLGTGGYRILPADATRVEVTVDRAARRFIRRHDPVRVRGTSFASRRAGYDSQERRRFKFRLNAR